MTVDLQLPALRNSLRRDSLPMQIAAKLQDLVATGLLHPGDELPGERELAAVLDVSRESVRGALLILVGRGFVDVAQGSRSRVASHVRREPPLGGDMAVLGARRVLEAALARHAACTMPPARLDHLRGLVEAQRAMLNDPIQFQISDREFHHAIFQAGGNPVLSAYAEQAYAHAYAHRREVMVRAGGIARAVQDHLAILDAMGRRSPDAAATAMEAHMDSITALLRGDP